MRRAWRVAGALALVALGSLAVRGCGRWMQANKAAQARQEQVISKMIALLVNDPRANLLETRSAVEEAAAFAESESPHAEALYALGLVRNNSGDYSGALSAFERAAFLRPEWSWPHVGRGISLHLLERNDDAIQAFEVAIKLAPTEPRAHDDLAILYRLLGRYAEAEREAKLALQYGPELISSHNNYGNLLLAQDRFDEAEVEYKKASEIDPDHATPYYNLACSKARRGDTGEALKYLEMAIQRNDAFKHEAIDDPDFESLATSEAFRKLTGSESTPK
jgi:Flp pilus assembly protein TadD